MTDTWLLTAWDTRNQDGHENVVVQTRWKLTVTDDDGNEGSFQGATPFSAEDVEEGEFVAFEDLDEETVMGWITGYVDSVAGYRDHIDERIAEQLARETNPITSQRPIPWNPEETHVPPPGDPSDADDEPAPVEPAPAPEDDAD